MRSMSLKQFKEEFYPNMKGIEFSAMLGFKNSLINKILNGRYDASLQSDCWKQLETLIKKDYGIQLITTSYVAAVVDNKDKTIERLKAEIKERDAIIEQYEDVIKDLLQSVRVICGAKEAIRNGEFKLEFYKNKTRK